jgi:hypothetical protein
LDVEIGFFVLSCGKLSGAGPVVLLGSIVDADELIVVSCLGGVWGVLLQEKGGVGADRDFTEAVEVSNVKYED